MIEFNFSREELDNNIDRQSRTWSIGDIFSAGFELWKENWLLLAVSSLIYFAISTVLGLIPYAGNFVFSLFIGPVLLGGMLTQAYEQDTKKQINIENLFSQFKKVGSFALATLITSFITLLLIAPALYALWVESPEIVYLYIDILSGAQPTPQQMQNITPPGPMTAIAALLGYIFIILIMTLFWLVQSFITFYDMNPIEALQYSFRAMKSKVFSGILLVFISAIAAMLGILACCIGIVATFPIMVTVQYALFKHITQFHISEEDEDGHIDKHLVS